MLKVMLVAVFVIGVAFSGYNAYRYDQLQTQVEVFNQQMAKAITQDDAKMLIKSFILSTNDDTKVLGKSVFGTQNANLNQSLECQADSTDENSKKSNCWLKQ